LPYARNSELPKAVQIVLPSEAQTIWRVAFNSFDAKLGDSVKCKQAWNAVTDAGWRPDEGDKWVYDAAAADFNPSHDPHSGEFSSGGGSGGGSSGKGGKRTPGHDDYEFEGTRKTGPTANDIKHANLLPTDTVMEDFVQQFGRAALKKLRGSDAAAGCTISGVQHDAGCKACDTGDNADCSCGAMDAAPPQPAKDSNSISVTVSEPATLVLDGDFKPRKTSQGFLLAFSRIARSGIQLYKGSEIGSDGKDELRVYRPSKEVFSRKSLQSYAGVPITNGHPPTMVDAVNWRKFAIGEIGEDVVRDGEFVRVPMMLRDAEAIKDYEDGKAELSLGYTMDLRLEPGTTPRGEAYDAVQTDIRANHLALVNAARGGPALRIGDDAMNTKQIVVDGLTVSLDARDAEVVSRFIEKQTKALDDLNTAIKLRDDQVSAAKKDSDTKDAKIATLEKQLKDSERTPEQRAAELQELGKVTDTAKKLLGDKFVPTYDANAIRKQVVDARMGEIAKGWSPEQVAASFESLAALGPSGGPRNAMDRVLVDGVHIHSSQDARDKAYEQMVNDACQAWKTPAQRKTA
jgi:uncharacterized protein